MVEIQNSVDTTMDISTTSQADIVGFLSRPVRLTTVPWTVTSHVFASFNPWSDWLSDKHVKEKLSNYELLRCNLHIKAVISGTGFHYGRAIVSYDPYSGFNDLAVARAFLDADICLASQKPCLYLNPSTNEGGEMILPYFYHKNYISMTDLDLDYMGKLYIKSINTLKHANGGNDPVNITIYAWAEDVTLTMPTSAYSPQSGKLNSGDEYGMGIISAPASAVAAAAGRLTNAPIVGPYARATQMCASAIGEVAKLFGYSRPPIVSNIMLNKPRICGNLANTDVSEAVQKLTLDTKQELTIDSRTVGLDGADQMTLKSIFTREAYLTQFDMTPSQTPDTVLFSTRVCPSLFKTFDDEIHPTPMSFVANMFEKWQGTIKFRFQIAKSQFHKGKLLVRWDPRAHGAVAYNTAYSRVIDIAAQDEFEIEIGYGQALPFLNTVGLSTTHPVLWSTSASLTADTTTSFNGVLEVNVLNPLVSPSSDSQISFNVFVSAGEDMKFGGPTDLYFSNTSYFPSKEPPASRFTPQSGEMGASNSMIVAEDINVDSDKTTIEAIVPGGKEVDHQFEVFFGEAPTSLRELLRRYAFSQAICLPHTAASRMEYITLIRKVLPKFRGWDPNGADAYQTVPCTYSNTTLLNYIMPCYAGWRGGVRNKWVFENKDRRFSRNPLMLRMPFQQDKLVSVDSVNDSATMQSFLSNMWGGGTFNGAMLNDLEQGNAYELEIPYYAATRMSPCRMIGADFVNGCDSVGYRDFSRNSSGDNDSNRQIISIYTSVGEDFTLFFFTGCPIIYDYAMPVSAD
ncbi:hypothetical protein 2 [Beihai picorna-like virus 9]|uniref:hypothetical protein 2 n=1 Tax=Beihai picorna-like virus 9 TaxID=1922636 RepID=UPI00090C5298|nr:hypothetical protein 2 [Beihai picorna-like virus 9]APG76737.1 hypothetical protein 2 [Beihai picorna-like virus 9]